MRIGVRENDYMKPEAFLFDIGNVLLAFDFNKVLDRLSAYSNVPGPEIEKLLEPLKHEYESGQITDAQFLDYLKRRLQFQGEERHLVAIWQEIFMPIEATHDLVQQLHRLKFPLYLLSNTNGLHAKYFLTTYRVFDVFRGGIYSHKVQMMKPNREIYEYAIMEFGLNPARTVFIDDLEPNVSTAKAVGFEVHHYAKERHEQLIKQLRGYGLDVYGEHE